MRSLLSIPMRAPRATLAVLLAVTVVFGFFARSIDFDSSMERLIAQGSPDLAYYHDVRKVFGNDDFLVIGVFADNVFAPETLERIDRLSEELSLIDGVREVVSLSTVEGVEMGDFGLEVGPLMGTLPTTLGEVRAFRDKIYANPIHAGAIVSEDGMATSVLLLLQAMGEAEFETLGIEKQVRALVEAVDGPEQFAITGVPIMRVRGSRMLEQDRNRFAPLTALVIAIVLVCSFRTVRGVVLPLVPVVVSLVWTTGFMAIMETPIDMGTVILHPLIVAIGVAYAIHLMSEYERQVARHTSKGDIVRATLDHVRLPTAMAAITTLLGFAVLSLNPIPATHNLGVYAVFGIAVTLLATFTTLPALLVLLPVPQVVPGRREDAWFTGVLGRLGTLPLHRPRLVLALALLCVGWSLWGVKSINVGTDFVGFFSRNSEVRRAHDLFTAKLAGTQPIYVIVDGQGPQAVTRIDLLAAIRDLQHFIQSQPGVDLTFSLVDYLAAVRGAIMTDAGPSLPESQEEIDQMLLLIDPAETRQFVSRDFSRANIAARTTISGSRKVNSFVERVEEFAATRFPRGFTVKVTSRMVLLNQSAETLTRSQVLGIAQMLALVFLIMCIHFRSVRVALLSLVPNVLPVIMLFGLMGWTGISLNVSTGMIAAIAIGIAVDDTIHYLSRFNRALRATGSEHQAAVNAMQAVGKPILVTSTAVAAGFLVVCLSNFEPIRHFGYLAASTMVLAVISDLFVTPAVAMTIKIIRH